MILFILPRMLRQKIAAHRPVVWLINILSLLLAFFCVHFFLFKIVENVTWTESLWQTWQTFTTVGYGNRPAESTYGRWVTILTSTGGIALLGILFSALVDLNFWNKERRRRGFMKNKYKDGYVIINFPGETIFTALIHEIRYIEQDVAFCIVDGRNEELPAGISMMNKVHFVSGSIYDRNTYEMASLKENKVVIVFPIESDKTDSDGITRTIVDSVSKFVGENTRVMYILMDLKNSWMFQGINSTQILKNLEVLALVQECQDKHSSRIIEKLLLNTEGANPKTVQPEKTIGWTWGELAEHSLQTAKNLRIIVNPLAIVQNNITNSCPAYDTVINKGDSLSIITYNTFRWNEFEDELITCKINAEKR